MTSNVPGDSSTPEDPAADDPKSDGQKLGTFQNLSSFVGKTASIKSGTPAVAASRSSAEGAAMKPVQRLRTSFLDAGGDGEKEPEKAMKSTFVDANAMKEKVRQNLTKPQHSVKDYYKTDSVFARIATSSAFEYTTLGIISFNALWIAIDTDYNDAELLIQAHPVFIAAENLFCAYFFYEWFVRYMSFKRKRDGLKDGWFVFDSFMVLMMVLETWVMTAILLLAGGASGGTGDASILRVARLLRLSRMARMARLLRALPELMIMIRGMVAATRSVFFTLCLLIIVMYVFGIAFTQLCAETSVGSKYFPTVGHAMFTLLISGTLLDNIGSVAKDLGEEQYYIAAIFFLFVLLAALTVMNMLIGVLCEVVNAVAATEKEEMLVTYVNQKLHRVVQLLDSDGGGTISKKEFMQILENSDAVRCLQDVGVDVIGLVDFAEYIFEDDNGNEEDEEHEGIELDFAKFMEVVLQLRGTNSATVKDIVDLRKFMRNALADTNKQLARLSQDNEVIRRRFSPEPSGSYHDHMAKKSHSEAGPSNGTKKSKSAPTDSSREPSAPYVEDTLHAQGFHAKDPQSSNNSSSSHHIAREHHNSSELLTLSCTQVEELPDVPKHIVWSSKLWSPIESIPPAPLQMSPSVHFLQPPLEDGAGSQELTRPGDGATLRGCTHHTKLSGQWYPYAAGCDQVVDVSKATKSITDPAVVYYAEPLQKAALAGNLEAVIKAPLLQADGNSIAVRAHGMINNDL